MQPAQGAEESFVCVVVRLRTMPPASAGRPPPHGGRRSFRPSRVVIGDPHRIWWCFQPGGVPVVQGRCVAASAAWRTTDLVCLWSEGQGARREARTRDQPDQRRLNQPWSLRARDFLASTRAAHGRKSRTAILAPVERRSPLGDHATRHLDHAHLQWSRDTASADCACKRHDDAACVRSEAASSAAC